jgi:DNA-directed RNA polymerase specialized sigma24 family protein
VQEVLIEFLESAPRIKIENGRLFRGLLFRIVENTQREQYRWWCARRRDIAREKPLPPGTVLDLESPRTGPGEALIRSEREGWIRLGLEFLDDEDQRVIVLRDYDQLSFVDIGEQMD